MMIESKSYSQREHTQEESDSNLNCVNNSQLTNDKSLNVVDTSHSALEKEISQKEPKHSEYDLRPSLGDTFDKNFNNEENHPQTLITNFTEMLTPEERDIDLFHKKLNDLGYKSLDEQYQDITKLDLRNLGLRTWPPQLFQLSNLSWLSLEGNSLEDIPDRVKELDSLQWLDVRGNKISSVSSKLSELENLKTLLLQDNLIRRVPVEIGTIRSLKALSLLGNPLEFPPIDVVHQGANEVLRYLRHSACETRDASPEPCPDDDHGFWRKPRTKHKNSSKPQMLKAAPVDVRVPSFEDVQAMSFDERMAMQRQLEEDLFKQRQFAEIERRRQLLHTEKRRKEVALLEKLKKAKAIEDQQKRLSTLTEKKRKELQGLTSVISDINTLESSRVKERALQQQEKERINSNIRSRFNSREPDVCAQKGFEDSLKVFDIALESMKREEWGTVGVKGNKNTIKLDPLPVRKMIAGSPVPLEGENTSTDDEVKPLQGEELLTTEGTKNADAKEISSMEKYKLAKAEKNDRAKEERKKHRYSMSRKTKEQPSLLKQKVEMERKRIQERLSKDPSKSLSHNDVLSSITSKGDSQHKDISSDFEFNAYEPDVANLFPSTNTPIHNLNSNHGSTSPVA